MSVDLECACAADHEHARTRILASAPAGLPPGIACETCGAQRVLRTERLTFDGGLLGCVVCGHLELYTQKRFPRALGVGVIVVAAVLAPFTWYASLALAALLDWILYRHAPDEVVCYVCGSRHRGFAPFPAHPRFDREIGERLAFGTRAVMGKPMRSGGTAGAPDPEH